MGAGKEERSVGLQLSVEICNSCFHPCSCCSVYSVSTGSSFFARGYRLKQQAINQIILSYHLAFSITVESCAVKAY